MRHIPVLRGGNPYYSLTKNQLTDFRSGEVLAEVSQANAGLIAKDLNGIDSWRTVLAERSVPELIEITKKAATIFAEGQLAIGEEIQSREDYIKCVSATTGMPKIMVSRNMAKIATAMEKTEDVLNGLTRGENLAEITQSFRRETSNLGAILPNNSPGVHSLWIPSVALQIPLTLKPGSREPWSPLRIAMAMIEAGCPKEAFSYYPTDVNGTREILMRSGKSMFFGDKSTVEAWRAENKVQLHGPGWSKVVVGADMLERADEWLDLMVQSIAANGGRSCINTSGLWLGGGGKDLAEKLAQRLAQIEARGMDDPEAGLCAFTNPKMATMISRQIDSHLEKGGAEDLTAKYRDGDRVVEVDGATFLLPTLIWCDEPDHPLARAEYLFPYCAAVASDDLPGTVSHTLVATVLSQDQALVDAFLSHTLVDRVNIGPIPTNKIRWDQPHEGNLFELLYHQRAIQFASF